MLGKCGGGSFSATLPVCHGILFIYLFISIKIRPKYIRELSSKHKSPSAQLVDKHRIDAS